MHMSVVPACMAVHSEHGWYMCRSEEGAGFPGTRVTDGCEQPSATGFQICVLQKSSLCSLVVKPSLSS